MVLMGMVLATNLMLKHFESMPAIAISLTHSSKRSVNKLNVSVFTLDGRGDAAFPALTAGPDVMVEFQ